MSNDKSTKLLGRTALVTGGSEGIGLAIAEAFVDAGASVVVLVRTHAALEHACAALRERATGSVRAVVADLADLSALDAALAGLDEPIDILVNNVGLAVFAPLADLTRAQIGAMVNLNLVVPTLLAQRFLPDLVARRGNIINISSYWADKMVAGRPSSVYSATRAGVVGLTRALANELGPSGVRVNVIAPGAIRTPTFERRHLAPMSDDERRRFEQNVVVAYPLGHIGAPPDVGAAALFLASDDARWVTGATLRVDGGLTVR